MNSAAASQPTLPRIVRLPLAMEWATVRRHPAVAGAVACAAAGAVIDGIAHGNATRSISYVVAMWVCAYCADLYAAWRPPVASAEVRHRREESVLFLIFTAIGLAFAIIINTGIVDMKEFPFLVRVALLPPIPFVVTLVIAGFYQAMEYSLGDLGLRLRGTVAALPAIVIPGLTAMLVAPSEMTWDKVFEQQSLVSVGFFYFSTATALSTELWRFLGQTRLGALMGSGAAGWLVTSLIWAAARYFVWSPPGADAWTVISGCFNLIPLGLMWGYLSHRTKSILPAGLAHGLNLWGLTTF